MTVKEFLTWLNKVYIYCNNVVGDNYASTI